MFFFLLSYPFNCLVTPQIYLKTLQHLSSALVDSWI